MDFFGFTFTPAEVVSVLVGAWGIGLVLGAISAVLTAAYGRR